MTKRAQHPKNNGTALLDRYTVKVNPEALTWEDMYLMTSVRGSGGQFTPELVADIRALFNRVVEGGAAAVPVVHTQAVLEQIGEAIAEMGNPGNSRPA